MTHPDLKTAFDVVTPAESAKIVAQIKELLAGRLCLAGVGRSHILRYGWDYNSDEWLGVRPGWIPDLMPEADSWTVNEYLPGRSIAPHIDSLKFADEIGVLSLGSMAHMYFSAPDNSTRFAVPMSERSLVVFSGELRNKWTHSTIPVERGTRYSIVYRKLRK